MATPSGCGLCPGYFNVWYWDTAPAVDLWVQIENIDSWTLNSNVTEATKKRTSSTSGLSVKFCEDVVDFTVDITTTLCKLDWLYCHLLTGAKNEMGLVRTGWWFLGWGDAAAPFIEAPTIDPYTPATTGFEAWRTKNPLALANPGHTLAGMLLYGSVVPPGFGGDNTSTDPTTASFSINVNGGPYLPTPSAACVVI